MPELAEHTTTAIKTEFVHAPFRQLFRTGHPFNLLLALENDDNAKAAVRITKALTARGAIPSVVGITALMQSVAGTPDSMVFYAASVLGEDFHLEREQLLRSLVKEITGTDEGWPVLSVPGDAAQSIVALAESGDSDLIVIGMHKHGAIEQAIGENTTTRVMARAHVPVLGVRPGLETLPKRIMVATDFGNASREAAHVAANLATPGGTVFLVHVDLEFPIIEEGDEGAALVQREGIEHAFAHLADELAAGRSIRVETVRRTGDATRELLAASRQIAPDLIVIAAQRHRLLTRLLLGSVTRNIVREAQWSTLVIPATEAAPTRATA